MGLGGVSIWQLLIILVIVVLLFGTKKLKGIGTDLGGAVKGFKDSVSDKDSKQEQDEPAVTAENSAEKTATDESKKEESAS